MLLLLVHLSVLECSKFLVIYQDKSHQMTNFIYLPTSRRPVVLTHSEDTMKRTTDLDLYTEMCFNHSLWLRRLIIWPGLIYTLTLHSKCMDTLSCVLLELISLFSSTAAVICVNFLSETATFYIRFILGCLICR